MTKRCSLTSPSTISVSVSKDRFDAFAALLASDMEADLILSSPGYPAETVSVAGLWPVAEMVMTKKTTPAMVRNFCFGTPGLTMGFVSYTYGMMLRGVASDKPSCFPHGHLKKYGATAQYDPLNGQVTLSSVDRTRLRKLAGLLKASPDSLPEMDVPVLPGPAPTSSLDKTRYEAGVRETLNRILSGYTYQLNLSTKFTWDCPDTDPLALFLALQKKHPAPFHAWLRSGHDRIVSTSPERFLRVTDGNVLSQPIKGTLQFEEYDPSLASQLRNSPKEDAELSMIVDLIRNDLSANCVPGSVRVENHKSIFAVDCLLQMYTDVLGELRRDRDCLDLFFDAFPGGSVTGCPKKSSMKIIEQLEPHERGIYCGSVVVIRDRLNMDSSIAIRTATYNTVSRELNYWAGSGIVVDSRPASEYLETIAKAEKFPTLWKQ